MVISIVVGVIGNVAKWLVKMTSNIVQNALNTEKSNVDLRKIVVTQTPVKDHQLT